MIHSLKKDEIKLGDKVSYQNIKRHAELDVLPDKTDIDFVLSLEKKVELAVVLPNGYPSWNSSYPVKPLVTLRLLSNPSYLGVNVRELSSRFNQWLDETANTGEPVLVASIDWLQNELTNGSLVTNESTKSLPRGQDLTGAERIICLWIISHHIRSSIKRRLILEWSKELELSGCCMPGRPGLIIVEGKETKADEYWRRLRNLQWNIYNFVKEKFLAQDCINFVDFKMVSMNLIFHSKVGFNGFISIIFHQKNINAFLEYLDDCLKGNNNRNNRNPSSFNSRNISIFVYIEVC
ncbi:unnamed protein product [Heterobilharzia americana]|nr:unnamed protein product [Heterobilharzia americana]